MTRYYGYWRKGTLFALDFLAVLVGSLIAAPFILVLVSPFVAGH